MDPPGHRARAKTGAARAHGGRAGRIHSSRRPHADAAWPGTRHRIRGRDAQDQPATDRSLPGRQCARFGRASACNRHLCVAGSRCHRALAARARTVGARSDHHERGTDLRRLRAYARRLGSRDCRAQAACRNGQGRPLDHGFWCRRRPRYGQARTDGARCQRTFGHCDRDR